MSGYNITLVVLLIRRGLCYVSSDDMSSMTPVCFTELAFGVPGANFGPTPSLLRDHSWRTAQHFREIGCASTMAAQTFHASSLSALHGASKRNAATAGAQLPSAPKRVPQFASSLQPQLRALLNAQPHAVMAPEVCARAYIITGFPGCWHALWWVLHLCAPRLAASAGRDHHHGSTRAGL